MYSYILYINELLTLYIPLLISFIWEKDLSFITEVAGKLRIRSIICRIRSTPCPIVAWFTCFQDNELELREEN